MAATVLLYMNRVCRVWDSPLASAQGFFNVLKIMGDVGFRVICRNIFTDCIDTILRFGGTGDEHRIPQTALVGHYSALATHSLKHMVSLLNLICNAC